ncbi:MAG: hypothetical protein ACREOU_16645 [Candidatus Eiseniibacteriota bacterium]
MKRANVRFAVLVATAVCAVTAACVALALPAEGADGSIEVQVIGQGKPVEGVLVRLFKDDGSFMEVPGQAVSSTPLARDTSDAKGGLVFRDLEPSRYIVTAMCERLPGNWIGGSASTKVELLPNRPGHATLTLRRGGMIRGRVTRGGVPYKDVRISTESQDALSSVCPVLQSQGPDSSGAFVVRKVPVGATSWVKANLALGSGELGVWHDFTMEKPETLDAEWKVPDFKDSELGSALFGVRLPTGEYVDKGRAELLLARTGDDGFRYQVNLMLGGADSLQKVEKLPPGRYNVRCFAEPGGKMWWNAGPDTLSIVPGKVARKIIAARPRQ